MKTPSKTLAAGLLAASLPWFASSALAAPIAPPPPSWRNAAPASIETVRWRGGPGIGFAVGAIIGGIIASSTYGYGYAPEYDYAPAYAPVYGYAPGYGYAPEYDYAPAYAPVYGYAPGYEYPGYDRLDAESQR